MSKVKSCDARCHNAKHEKCTCWCGGRFHGKANQPARDKFIEALTTGQERLEPGNSFDVGNTTNCINIKGQEDFDEMANLF